MRRIAVLCIIGVFLVFNSAWADDYYEPTWRGQENTTWAIWEFGDDTSPSAPDDYVNSLGIPILTVQGAGTDPKTEWLFSDPPTAQFGVWRFEDWIEIEIPNFAIPNDEKEIWIQLTYYADSIGQGFWPVFSTIPGFSSIEQIDSSPADDQWYYHETYSLIIEPNPDFETIRIQPRNCTFFVDEIVIDTICRVPEPTTICFLGLGGLALLRKRRRA